LNDLVNEAVSQYAYRLQREKIERETAAYERMHNSIRDRFLGQWVAIHNGHLVDHDCDLAALHRRVRERFGRTAVLLRQVRESPVEEIRLRTRSTGRIPS
jgi:hypothetical protein